MPGQVERQKNEVLAGMAALIAGIVVFVGGIVALVARVTVLGGVLMAAGIVLVLVCAWLMYRVRVQAQANTRDLQAEQQATLRGRFGDQPGHRLP